MFSRKAKFISLVITFFLLFSVIDFHVKIEDSKIELEFLEVYALDPWYNTSWSNRKAIDINSSKVEGDETNFSVLIHWTSDSDINGTAQADADDILFTSSDGVTKLDHEIEYYSEGALTAWVEVASLSGSADTQLYIYYGNAGASNQENATGTWDSNYVMVQHMTDLNSTNIEDSTSNKNDGTKKAANEPIESSTAQIYRSQDFDGDDYITIDDASSLRFGASTDFSIFVWIKTVDTTADIVAKSGGGAPLYRLQISTSKIRFGANDGTNGAFAVSTDTIDDDAWHLVGGTFDRDGNVQVYIDGVANGSAVNGTSVGDIDDNAKPLIGDFSPGTHSYYDGIGDEVQISNCVRSANWIKTSYNTQNDPSTFYTVGSEESHVLGVSTPTTTFAYGQYAVNTQTSYKDCNATNTGNVTEDIKIKFSQFKTQTTVTFYSTSSDGYIYDQDATFSTAHDNTTGDVIIDTAVQIGQNYSDPSYYIYRGFVYFDTSSIPDDATITSATLSLYGANDYSTTDFNATVQTGGATYPHDPLEVGDYDKDHYSGDGGTFDTSGFSTLGYNDITLNSTGRGWISKTGTTKLCIRSSRDIANTTPTGAESVVAYSNEQGSGYEPKLTVTYGTASLHTWSISNSAAGADTCMIAWSIDASNYTYISAWDTYVTVKSSLAVDAVQRIYIKITTPTSVSSGGQYYSTMAILVVES